MFEDLLGNSKPKPKSKADEICPACGSTNIKILFGVFKSATKYVSTAVCLACNNTWKIEYDKDLNVIS